MKNDYITINIPLTLLINSLKEQLTTAFIEEVKRQMTSEASKVDNDKLLSLKEASKLLGGLSRPTMNKLIRSGTLKAFRVGGQLMFNYQDVMNSRIPVKTTLYSRNNHKNQN